LQVSYPAKHLKRAYFSYWNQSFELQIVEHEEEKQYLAYYSGMNLTQLSMWFANARRRIKKKGMKTWLEGRSTFTVDRFPFVPTRPIPPMAATAGYSKLVHTSVLYRKLSQISKPSPNGNNVRNALRNVVNNLVCISTACSYWTQIISVQEQELS